VLGQAAAEASEAGQALLMDELRSTGTRLRRRARRRAIFIVAGIAAAIVIATGMVIVFGR